MEDEVKINIFKNQLVPKSRIITEKEEKELLLKYKVSKKQLPRISTTDPVSKQLDAKPGNIIEFQRKTRTAGLSVFYRVVRDG